MSRLARAAVILSLVTLAGAIVAAPAQAAAYRYWGYFHLAKGAWTFAQTGPGQSVPADGTVEGWRFAVADESSIRTPRATLTFDALCADTAVKSGTKRVGLVIDYGRPADAAGGAGGTVPPAARATCVAVPVKATGSDILVAAGATLRLDKALTCAIDGWPVIGCGPVVNPVSAAAASPDTKITIAAPPVSTASAVAAPAKKSADTSAAKDSTSSTGSGPLYGVTIAIFLVVILGFVAWRRSQDATDS